MTTARQRRRQARRSGDNLNGDGGDGMLEKIGLTQIASETTAELLRDDCGKATRTSASGSGEVVRGKGGESESGEQ